MSAACPVADKDDAAHCIAFTRRFEALLLMMSECNYTWTAEQLIRFAYGA
ncbi:hypothetical protein [Caballeronia glathei]|nr:hypothetical protein [Caballeronia glathei]